MTLKIVIKTDRDLTPAGKRTARCVQTTRGGRQLRWYVAGRLYHHLAVTPGNIALTHEWGADQA
jgi:hypothetical protein